MTLLITSVLCLQRLMRDFKRLRQDPPQGVNGSPNPDNIMLWNAVIFGPEDTPWDGGMYAADAAHVCCLAGLIAGLLLSCTVSTAAAQTCCLVLHCTGTFKLTLEFTEDYPNKAPTVKFKSTMFHPNSKCLMQASSFSHTCTCDSLLGQHGSAFLV